MTKDQTAMNKRGQWDRVRRVARILHPWVDPASYRPLVLLVVVALAVFLAPLGLDVAHALFYGLPPWWRWSLGEAAFLVLVAAGLRRLWQVRPTDAWPSAMGVAEPGPDATAARWVPWALRLAVASLALPILRHPDGLGFADWDFVLDKFEAMRRTILIWGQFPWWDPWCRGGFPLAAEPQIGAISLATPLVLTLGTTIGLRLAAILGLAIAVEGAYRLAWLWFREPWSAAATALIYGLNGAVLINTAQGYVLAMSYGIVPWLAYYAFRIGDRRADGLWLGFWAAFAVMNGLQYVTFYGGLLAALIGLRAVRIQPRGCRLRLLRNATAAIGMALAVCGWRLATVLPVLRDDRRERATYWDESPLAVFDRLLARPLPDWPEVIPGRDWATFIELTAYVGPVVLVLALASLAHGWRWWHTLALAAGWMALGSVSWYHPSYWVAEWPLFASTHVVTRWKVVALLGLGLAAGSVLARWRRSGNRVRGALAILAVVAIAADFVALGYEQLPWAFGVRPEPDRFPGPPVRDIVNVHAGLGYACVLRGYGVIQGYEPMLGYRRDAPTLRRAREHPDYRGESWTAGGPVRPVSWSPNRLVFQVAPGEEVWINQNPGSWWWANGRPAFPGHRCAEPMVPFVARADGNGRLELRIHPPGLETGIALHVVGAALLAAGLGRRRWGNGPV
jgi:hypothetical protein